MNKVNRTCGLIGWSCLLFLLCSFAYRVIPMVSIGGKTYGRIEAEEFAKYKALHLNPEQAERCEIKRYTLYHISLCKAMEELKGHQAQFSSEIAKSIKSAEKGDKYIFFNIYVKCTDNDQATKVNALNFNIK